MICCCTGTSGTPLYIMGGLNLTGTWYANCDKVDMSAESVSSPSTGNLTTARGAAGGAANPSVAGYVCGGQKSGGTNTNIADKLLMSNDTTSAVSSANLSYSNAYIAGMSERTSKAYFAGGSTGPVATANVLTFSGDSTSAASTANLSQARGETAAMNGNSTKGYWAGGRTGGAFTTVVTADKTVFSGDSTAAQTSANLSTHRALLEGGSDGSTKGYWIGGDNNGTGSDIQDKILISTDTTSFLAHTTYHDSGGMGSDGNKLMYYGGQDNISSPTNQGRKVTFATDAEAGAGGVLSTARYSPAGFSGAAL